MNDVQAITVLVLLWNEHGITRGEIGEAEQIALDRAIEALRERGSYVQRLMAAQARCWRVREAMSMAQASPVAYQENSSYLGNLKEWQAATAALEQIESEHEVPHVE